MTSFMDDPLLQSTLIQKNWKYNNLWVNFINVLHETFTPPDHKMALVYSSGPEIYSAKFW